MNRNIRNHTTWDAWRKAAMISLAALIALAGTATARAQDFISFGQPVGVFSATEFVRLDIGLRAVKAEVPGTHESWATRLYIRRLDGPSVGPVLSSHLVGIFSEDGRVRLDIGTRAMKENVPASHRSWATVLYIRRLDGPNYGQVRYGDLVGFFSQDGRVRLDIGSWAMLEEVPAYHESWATRLVIRPD